MRDVSNFNRTKCFSGNQALNKNSSNSKKQRQRQFDLEVLSIKVFY